MCFSPTKYVYHTAILNFVKVLVLALLDQTIDVFLIKKKRDDADDGVGCSCNSPEDVCGDDCECRSVFQSGNVLFLYIMFPYL